MKAAISLRIIKAWQKFNASLDEFRKETGDDLAILYEDAYTSRNVKDFQLSSTGVLTWVEDGRKEREQMFDDDEANDYLKFWKSCLRRAKRYWSMDVEKLDAIQDPENETNDSEED